MRKMFGSLSVAVCLLCFAGALEAGPIVNGSFEYPEVGTGWGTYSTILGWTATGTELIEIGYGGLYGVTGYDADQVLELDSYGNAVVAQAVTTPGGLYDLTFLYAMRGGTAPGTNMFEVYWNSTLITSITPTSTAMSLFSAQVVAVGGDTLSFVGTGTKDTYGGIIDNVQLNAVPDGGMTLSLLGMGLAGLGWLRRRR